MALEPYEVRVTLEHDRYHLLARIAGAVHLSPAEWIEALVAEELNRLAGATLDWSRCIKALQANGWTLTNLAKEVGISVSGLSDIKQGRSSAPRGMVAVKLHDLYAALGERAA